MTQVSERLRKVLAAGDIMALFSLLKDWPVEELQALLRDVEETTEFLYTALDDAWVKLAFRPDVFFSPSASKEVDRFIRDEEKVKVTMVMSEICSVAYYYLHARGVNVDLPEEE